MTAWLIPGLAAAMWAGLLLRPSVGEAAPVWAWLLAAALAFAGALFAAPRRGEDVLAAIAPGRGALPAVTPSPASARRAPAWAVVAFAVGGTLALGVGWGSVHADRLHDAAIADLAPGRASLEGVLRIDPRPSRLGWNAIVDVATVRSDDGSFAVHEAVWVSGEDGPPEAFRGDRVRLEGRLEVPDPSEGFGSFLERRGIVAELDVDEVERLGPSSVAFVRWAQSFRSLIRETLVRLYPERQAGLLLGLSIGDDSLLDPALERDFRASGLSHLLVVSGGNVAMLLAPLLALASLLRIPRWPRFALGVGTVAFFVVLTGAEPSVMRAGVMAGIGLFGVLLGRPRSTGTILAAAVFVLLVADPTLVWAVGFQLSVLATAGMVALATPLAGRLRFLPEPVALAAAATLAAQAAVTPLLLFHFHEVPLSTLVANVIAFPAVAPAMLLGLGSALAAMTWAPLGALLALGGRLPLRYLEAVADRTARAPVAWITGGGIPTLVVGLALAFALAWWLRSGRRVPRAAVAGALALAPIVVWTIALSSGPPSSLTVRFIDVGQGDAALLTSAAGATILVDGGPDDTAVATELAALGVKRLDLVVASHPHADHIVGLPAVLARVPVALLLEPGCPTESTDAVELRDAVDAEDVPVASPRAGDRFEVGDVLVEILSPDRCWRGTESDTNNDAIVLRASVGEDSILFATEPEEPAQQVLLDGRFDLTADVLKVPHHGSATSIRPFFEAIHAAVAVVSVGPNPYGHPVPEVLEWIREAGAEVWRTDEAGDVIVSFRDHRVLVHSGG